jgi:hypothetical protein
MTIVLIFPIESIFPNFSILANFQIFYYLPYLPNFTNSYLPHLKHQTKAKAAANLAASRLQIKQRSK